MTALVVRSTTVTLEVALVLLTVSAKWRRLSTATLVGEVPTEIGLPIFCRYVGLEGSRSTSFAVKSVSGADEDANRVTVTWPVTSRAAGSGAEV